LIAISSHGMTGLEHALFGSVTEQLLRQSSIPIIVFRVSFEEEQDAFLTNGGDFRTLLVPLESGTVSSSILPVVLELSRFLRSRVLLLHVLERPGKGSAGPQADVEAMLERAVRSFKEAGVETRILIKTGNPAAQIQSVALAEKADL